MQKEEATSPEKKAALETIRCEFKGAASRSQAARVLQLRKQGHSITTHWKTVVTEAGEKHRVGLYVLAGAGHDQELQAQ